MTDEQHKALKIKSAETGLPQAEVARRLLLAWLVDEIDLPEEQEQIEINLPQGEIEDFREWLERTQHGDLMPYD